MNPIVRNSGLSASLLALSAIAFATSDSVRKTRELNDAWQFHLCKHADCTIDQLRATDWQPVEIPHTWNAQDGQDGGNNYFRGVGWYQRTLQIDRTSNHVRHFLRFRAASIVADVYIDGVHIGQHRGAFAAFCFEITDAISDGKSHQLMVRVDNRLHEDVMPLSGDFTMFGGIYRGVELISTSEVCISPLRFASSGVYLTQIHATPKEAKFGVNVYVQNEKQATKNVSIRALLLDAAENEVTIDEFKKRNESEGVEHYSSTLTIKQPRRWDGKADPYRYTLRVELIRRNAGENQPEILDVVEQTFGAREFRVDPQQGVFLNGKPLDLHGVSRHQDRLDKGWAISRADMEEDFKIIDELGCTIVRLAHYQHDSYAYELADRAGIVVWAEIPLIDKITDSKAFLSNAEQQLTELIHQNHNHPSICFWGIHNEVTAPWKQPSPDPTEVVKRLNEVAKDADPTRLTVSAACDPVDHPANWQTDLTAFNRYFGWYTGEPDDIAQWCDDTHKKYPRTPLGISEYGAGASIHHHEWPPTKPVHNGPQHPEEWQTYLHERHWEAMKKRPYLWCKIIWNGFDFAVDSRNEGDTKGRNDKGLVTIDRKTKKDAWYWVQSQWSEKPMIHISHAARDALGAAAPIRIYSNCETVTVEIDGREVANHRDYDGAINYETFDLHPGTQSFKAIGRQGDQTVEATCVVVISRDSQK